MTRSPFKRTSFLANWGELPCVFALHTESQTVCVCAGNKKAAGVVVCVMPALPCAPHSASLIDCPQFLFSHYIFIAVQLARSTFTYNLHEFGLSEQFSLEFLRKQVTIANLPKGTFMSHV